MIEKEEDKVMLKITALDNSSVEFTALLTITDEGVAYLQKRASSSKSNGFMSIHDIVGDVAKVGDYVYLVKSIVPGEMITEIRPIEDITYHRQIFEDYENDCLRKSYSSYIRDYKIKTITDEK